MAGTAKRVNFIFPEEVLEELRRTIPERGRSAFVAEATRMKLLAKRQREALARTAGAWSDEDYSNLTTEADMVRYRTERDIAWSGDLSRVAEAEATYDVSPRQ